MAAAAQIFAYEIRRTSRDAAGLRIEETPRDLATAEATRCRLLTLDERLDHAATSIGLGREQRIGLGLAVVSQALVRRKALAQGV